jgi:serine protease AprX
MENGCGQYIDSQIVIITGMEEYGNFQSSLLQAAPNPSNGSTVITYTMPEQGDMKLELYNVLGEKVADLTSGNESEGQHNATIDFAALGLSSGSYIVKLTTPSHYSTLNVIYSEK